MIRSSQKNAASQKAVAAGRGCGALFFLVFAIAGGAFAYMMLGGIMKDVRTRSWVATDAVLIGQPTGTKSNALERDNAASNTEERVAYRYNFEGRNYTGDRVTPDGSMKMNGRSSDSGRRLANMPVGTRVTCYVNPANPAEAVLEQRSLTYAWFLLLPGIFLLVGLGGVYFSLFGKTPDQKPVSERHKPTSGKAGVIGIRIFGSVFIAVGLVATWFLAVKPTLQARDAESWNEVPCRIKEASVSSSRGSKGGTTYSIRVLYDYKVRGQAYTGDRYNFSTGSSSSRDWRAAAVAELRANPSPVCYVNPNDPFDAVLSREVGSERWFGLIPLVFFFVGLAIFVGAPKMAAKSGGVRGLPTAAPLPQPVALAHGGYELKPGVTPKAGCVGMGCLSLFWNGITWMIFLQPNTPIVVRLFLMIFVLVGLGMLGGFGYFFLSMFNPKATVIADAQTVRLGQSIKLKWKIEGNAGRISHLAVTLTAKESATYRRGTSTTTDHNLFLNELVFETRDRMEIASGEVTVVIPAESMHSFEASNNKVVWAIKLHGDIAKWPDVALEFPITVLPHSPQTQTDSAV
jgi:hypothetical protein